MTTSVANDHICRDQNSSADLRGDEVACAVVIDKDDADSPAPHRCFRLVLERHATTIDHDHVPADLARCAKMRETSKNERNIRTKLTKNTLKEFPRENAPFLSGLSASDGTATTTLQCAVSPSTPVQLALIPGQLMRFGSRSVYTPQAICQERSRHPNASLSEEI